MFKKEREKNGNSYARMWYNLLATKFVEGEGGGERSAKHAASAKYAVRSDRAIQLPEIT